MIATCRSAFNQAFSPEKYQAYLQIIQSDFPGALDFRVAETPVFIPKGFKQKMLDTCEDIIQLISSSGYKIRSDQAIPPGLHVPGEEGHPHFLIFDFGICTDDTGAYTPMLIEMQGFATLFAYQLHQYGAAASAYHLPTGFSPYFGDFNEVKTKDFLQRLITADTEPGHTVLLELFPEKQKTRIDFKYTEKFWGVPTVCLTEIHREGADLYYNRNGQRIKIERIYNRIIFDELSRQAPDIRQKAQILFQPLNVKWVTHPNWFYRVSKYTLPFLDHPNVPKTWFLSEIPQIPPDLENYVLKPLFSFAGQGVIIDVKIEDIEAIAPDERKNYILQKKVPYAPAIETPDEPAKAELRVFYLWPDGAESPVPVCNLARLTKEKMVSVAMNKNKTWIGGSFALFEQ